ncbi:DUF1501 domain-containing protein [Kineosporia succinea]|uniref:Uncharacterized protein (DUF1501 family) n=1 Tax=Kineosporia succinea TaxID=84632 RepID=A0ABT9PDU7_9ACTN|nr:DUF1501 domain-containing protein [Kineosporia succinea]MDP9830875.1 uncharacterized protein (DUF1501 family) [Kineosporia succinea]
MDVTCGCPENAGLTRRGLLRGLGAAGVAAGLTTASGVELAFGAAAGTGTLVVLSLHGGFDGLSAIVPNGDADYLKSRPNIGVQASVTKKVDSMFGLHPALKPIYGLWDAGQMAAVHAVGQDDPSRSHFAAQEAMERAAPGSSLRTGWIDRTLGSLGNPGGLTGTQVGEGSQMPTSMLGPNLKFAVSSIAGVKLEGSGAEVPLSGWKSALKASRAGTPATVWQPLTAGFQAVGNLSGLAREAADPSAYGYPDSPLGRALHDVARLIKADLGLSVATVDQGDWDMHAGLGKHDSGWMYRQLTELSTALAAFAEHLGTTGMAKTTLVTLSEFGRRIDENGSGGLDHGHGNAVFLLGGGLKKGVHGKWPGLAAKDRVDGDLAGTTDYRSIVAELLTERCGVKSTTGVFPGYKPEPVGLFA